ncbi:MAG: GDP-6-deoxy-D-mannose reductase [Phycisphaerae bacterium]|nr:GDP-6-deoxy-D-mannose reductase [Phycisphaerae bacterium]
MQTVLVTGAEGFTGSHLIEALRQRGYDVVAGVRNRGRKLALERRSIKAVVCDVSDAINVARAVASVKPQIIVHLAGSSRPYTAMNEPMEAYQSIVTGWASVLDAARRVVPRARLLLASAADVYGRSGAGGTPLKETAAIEPVTTFGALKAAAESIATTFFRNYHLDVMIVRPFLSAGAGQPEHFFFGSAAQRIAQWDASRDGNELKLPDLSCVRDVLPVSEVVEAYVKLIESGKPNVAYNVCSGRGRSCRELIEGMIRGSGKSITLTELPSSDHEQQLTHLVGDNGLIAADVGWKPSRSLDDTLSDMVKYWQQVPAGRATTPAPATAPRPVYQ